MPSCREQLRDFLAMHPPATKPLSRPVRDVLDTIHARVFDPTLSVHELKRHCRISDNNISCRFKYEVGISIKVYVELLRLRAARHLLSRDELSIAEVAQTVGYAYLQTFYRAYRRHFDDCPSQVRGLKERGAANPLDAPRGD